MAWQHPVDRGIHPIALLRHRGDEYSFRYVRAVLEVPDFRPLLGFGDLREVYTSDRLFPLFAQRALDPRRPDYQRYVSDLGLDPSDATPWEQITRSSGRRNGDTLQLFPVPHVVAGQVSCSFLVHGIRHLPENRPVFDGVPHPVTAGQIGDVLDGLVPGAPLALVPEPTNANNPEAILVVAGEVPVGYVPDLLVRDLHRLREVTQVHASVIRVNGPDAPSHLRVLAELAAERAHGFEFFQDPRWAPLAH
ncbi:hypothetical protein [Cellulomonas sp. P24]|uniref:hypothetical protein n=1 Tax=Cellulomonas sp. P24 TaxID=2885206 RepID=UPI00216B17FB|nr:hypothetical protein [Cellulomonas sp. P24]MCR6492724.1 hypothetical protein [Cellulomonas sp. P24]